MPSEGRTQKKTAMKLTELDESPFAKQSTQKGKQLIHYSHSQFNNKVQNIQREMPVDREISTFEHIEEYIKPAFSGDNQKE